MTTSRSEAAGVKTPVAAIRANCLDCCCGSTKAVRECPISNCTLHPYRLGKRPTAEERRAYEKVGSKVRGFDEDDGGAW